MRNKEIVTESREYEKVKSIICDLCGANFSPDWNAAPHERIDIKIFYDKADGYIEGGSGFRYEIDCCPRCFVDRLIPFVNQFGITKIKLKEYSW